MLRCGLRPPAWGPDLLGRVGAGGASAVAHQTMGFGQLGGPSRRRQEAGCLKRGDTWSLLRTGPQRLSSGPAVNTASRLSSDGRPPWPHWGPPSPSRKGNGGWAVSSHLLPSPPVAGNPRAGAGGRATLTQPVAGKALKPEWAHRLSPSGDCRGHCHADEAPQATSSSPPAQGPRPHPAGSADLGPGWGPQSLSLLGKSLLERLC